MPEQVRLIDSIGEVADPAALFAKQLSQPRCAAGPSGVLLKAAPDRFESGDSQTAMNR
jgi:hypothetical protein